MLPIALIQIIKKMKKYSKFLYNLYSFCMLLLLAKYNFKIGCIISPPAIKCNMLLNLMKPYESWSAFFYVTKQHCVSIFFTRLWSVRKSMLFQYKGPTKMSFLCFLASFLFAVWFCICTHAQLRIQKISRFYVSKSIGLRTDHNRVKKIETQYCSVTQTS